MSLARLVLDVARDVARQVGRGSDSIFGMMIESNIEEGRQDVVAGQKLTYGQSITDPCINWADSSALLEDLAAAVRLRRGD
jgi:3-deoxy-7-phosphoheptulonate synthase